MKTWNKTLAVFTLCGLGLVGCTSSGDAPQAEGDQASITLTNCGQEVTYPGEAKKMLVNDGNIMSLVLAADAIDAVTAVSSMQRDLDILQAAYGDAIASKEEIAEKYPTLEEIVASQADVYVAGWGYGLSEDKGITPERLAEYDIATYVLSESCRQQDGEGRGVINPYDAVREDLHNIGLLTGNEKEAKEAVQRFDKRLDALEAAPEATKEPVVLVFDSGTDTVFTSGRWGAPQGIIEAAGAKNAMEGVEDTWVSVNWEAIAEQQPDAIAFVDYPGQTLEEKVELLRSHPVTKDLPAVKENRFINLPYAMWCESPLNVDAAEHVRKALEYFKLVPESTIAPELALPDSVPGQEYTRG
ncbi:ABC transporter substrate-binding protein [Corynebacterium kozikiae]|uniref:ABC transporter substrate-binding protein n=1 Tax=Corynebacterium kozikiae TaxID=2968469 RepID=UPI00211BE086|nr:ABC transporter substrate-binding protein [Corynebacterium sp. 76QC2CO]MCQ9344026.1 ABC transporter substrate-binding protein [Corynebacterium sp. 76QC2CO]